jgi:hypothetical protein
MISVDEKPKMMKRMNRNQRKRAGIISPGNKINTTKTSKTPRLEGHRKRVHEEVKPSEKRSKLSYKRTKHGKFGPN